MTDWTRWLLVAFFAAGCSARASGGIGVINPFGDGGTDALPTGDTVTTLPDGFTFPDVPRTFLDVPIGVDIPVGVDIPTSSCPGTETMCDGFCTNTSTDPNNCEFCGNACGAGSSCVGATCTTPCVAPAELCSGVCTSVQSNVNNCGTCGRVCPSGDTCVSGSCQATTSTVPVGSTCTTDAACGTGGACIGVGMGFPGGYCVAPCPSTAAELDTCTPGSGVCLNTGSALYCYPRCTPGSTAGCRSGYVCRNISSDNTVGFCVPNCAPNPALICGADECVPSTGLCGDGCTSSATCTTGSTCNTTSMNCDCSATTNCGTNASCYTTTTAGDDSYCGCANNAYCNPGQTCDITTGTCS